MTDKVLLQKAAWILNNFTIIAENILFIPNSTIDVQLSYCYQCAYEDDVFFYKFFLLDSEILLAI